MDGQREISFDEWAKQYEWRYDADERLKDAGNCMDPYRVKLIVWCFFSFEYETT